MKEKEINATVTVVIATYNRPEVLKKSIQSVLSQTYSSWVLYVVGDNCSPSTEEALNTFSDSRIYYYNNSFRFGEQSGGNSIGVALAQTKYVAYLNHDDLWASNHLEVAVALLEKKNADVYFGRSVFLREFINDTPSFKEVSNLKRKPFWTFLCHPVHFEPCSTIVLRTDYAHKVGSWKQAVELYRTPLHEYVMRLWLKKGKLVFGKNVTCIKLNQHQLNHQGAHQYEYLGNEHDVMLSVLSDKTYFSSLTEEHLLLPHVYRRFNEFTAFPLSFRLKYFFYMNVFSAYWYYFTGIDLYSSFCEKTMKEKGEALLLALERRTGEKKMIMQNMKEVIHFAKEKFHNQYNC